MKRLTKNLAIPFLAGSMLLSLAGCQSSGASSSSTSDKVTLTFWNIATTDPGKTAVNNVVKEWNEKNPNVQIKTSVTENNAYKTKIKAAIAGGDAPDIMYSWAGGFTKPFVDAGKILPLDSYLNDGTKDKMLPGALTNVTYNSKVYGLTYNQQAGALYVNKDMFDSNGIKIPTTFDELLTAVKAFRAKGITPMAVGEKDEWPGMWYFDMIALRMAGSQLSLDALNKKSSFDNPAFVNAAEKLQELVKAQAFDPGALSITRDDSTVQLTQGKIPMYFGGNFDAGTIDASAMKGKIIAVKFPSITGGSSETNDYLGGGADCLLVNASTKDKADAVKAAKFLAQNLSSQFYLTGAGLPEWKYDDVDQSKIDPLSKQIMSDIVTGSKASVPAWDLYLEGADAQNHQDLVAKIFGGQITPEEFAKQMQSQVGANK
ncbi:extracellular solute-binding protein [Clostridium akagii]|uniref:extracellular solute-binding protein n=1 Tax=Clostridium akagii TaxID=91623 RepID=UPI00047CA7A7|nr:extracellular solute-binding protein [Clostridium akagii]